MTHVIFAQNGKRHVDGVCKHAFTEERVLATFDISKAIKYQTTVGSPFLRVATAHSFRFV